MTRSNPQAVCFVDPSLMGAQCNKKWVGTMQYVVIRGVSILWYCDFNIKNMDIEMKIRKFSACVASYRLELWNSHTVIIHFEIL